MTKFYGIKDISDLYVDAMLRNEQHELLFISLWGLDTAIQSFLGKLSLPCTQGGIDRFEITPLENDENYSRDWCRINHPDHLQKHSGRVNAKHSLFNDLAHLWVYDKSTTCIDYANRRCLLLKRQSEDAEVFSKRLWEAIKTVCPVPLLDTWKTIKEDFQQMGWIKNHKGIQVEAYQLDFSDADVETTLSTWIRQGKLTLPKPNIHLALVKS